MRHSTGMPAGHRLTLMTVHGHPDDETVHTGGIMARYAAEGLRVICVVATRGEVGEIIDPARDTAENRERLGSIREAELRAAVAALAPAGGIEIELLGYRDSGTMGRPENGDPRAFWQADEDEAVARLVELIQATEADVIVSPNQFGTDGHPDHMKAAAVARAAYLRAGGQDTPDGRPAGAASWRPSKLYESVTDTSSRRAKLRQLLRTRPWPDVIRSGWRYVRTWRPSHERHRARVAGARGEVTTRVDIRPFVAAKLAAMRAHATQIDPAGDLFALSPQARATVTPTEDFTLAASRLPVTIPEDDLFAGLRPVDGR